MVITLLIVSFPMDKKDYSHLTLVRKGETCLFTVVTKTILEKDIHA